MGDSYWMCKKNIPNLGGKYELLEGKLHKLGKIWWGRYEYWLNAKMLASGGRLASIFFLFYFFPSFFSCCFFIPLPPSNFGTHV